MADLPARLDDRMLAQVERIAALPVPPAIPADERFFDQCMRTLRLLPGRADDDLSGKLRLAIYRRHFGHLTREALSYLVETATLTLDWFPTPAQCNRILAGWTRTDPPFMAHRLARAATARERQARFDELIARFERGEVVQAEAADWPERWCRILTEQGWLHPETRAVLPPRDQRAATLTTTEEINVRP